MKYGVVILSILWFCLPAFAQKVGQEKVDSLLSELTRATSDTVRINLLTAVAFNCIYSNHEQGLEAASQAQQLAEKNGWAKGIAGAKTAAGRIQWRKGNYEEALKNHTAALEIYQNQNDRKQTATLLTYIGQDYADDGKYAEAHGHWTLALHLYEALGDQSNVARVHILFGWLYENLGNTAAAVTSNFTALKIYEKLGDKSDMAVATSAIASDYMTLGNYAQALSYYRKALKAHLETGNRIQLPGTYVQIGQVYLKTDNFVSALSALDTALKVSIEITDTVSLAESYDAFGQVFMEQKNYTGALNSFRLASLFYEKVGYKQQLSKTFGGMATCYTRLQQFELARQFFNRQLEIATALKTPALVIEYYGGVYQLDRATGNMKDAYLNYKRYIAGRDSLSNAASMNTIVQMQLSYEQEKKEAVAKAEQEKKDIREGFIRNSFLAGLGGSLIFLAVVYRQRNKLAKQKRRSDELLLNILPQETAEELKTNGSAAAKSFNAVTVMFTDFKDFTRLSEQMSARELVSEINFLFSEFDKIISKYKIEKIKTIGDGYMCAGGLPAASESSATDVVAAALEIQHFINQLTEQRTLQGQRSFEIRIGVHTGSVIAGIVGIKKFAYDIWGDTVNIASRMETSGEVGRVNISGSTYELVKEKFHCTYRGKIEAKNKGEVDMYFVESTD
jgi:class 3 adenylate cyclase/Tfp pilus assembly protein PilF